jgi:hypothetical protein
MKDLDFDELDRAVNSLMTNVPKTVPRTDEEKEKTLDITPTLDDDTTTPPFDRIEALAAQVVGESKGTAVPSVPVPTRPVPPASPIQPPQPSMVLSRSVVPSRSQITAPSSAAAPASRRGGRFMDVVHPSSDMKKPEVAGRLVSRQGVSLQPQGVSASAPQLTVAPIVTAVGKEESTPLSGALTMPSQDSTNTPTVHDQAVLTSDWPDPLDVAMKAGASQKRDEQLVSTIPALNGEVTEEKPEANDPPSTASLASPFLPDAKVEKRPLGAPEPNTEGGDTVPAPWIMPTDDSKDKEKSEDSNDQLLINPGAVELQLPEELQGDLMAVEADTTHDSIKKEQEKMPVENEKSQVTPQPIAAASASSVGTVPTGPTSIPQQYREEPSTGDQKNGSIYDTDDYHQPLAHPAKKKSGWMWVLWAVIVLLLGAGAGAALYYFKVV